MRLILASGAMMLTVLAVAAGPDPRMALGRFKWAPTAEAVTFYHRHQSPVPTGQIVLSAGGLFRYTMTDEFGSETTLGTFSQEGERVFFKIESGSGTGLPARMRLDSKGLFAAGATFIREKAVVEAFARIDASMRDEASAPPPTRSEVQGTWTLRSSGNEVRTTRFTFTKDGSFRYEGLGGSSAGRYKVTDDGIELTYTEIDGDLVESGNHFHKTLPFIAGGSAFKVDTYRYERAGS